MVGGRGGGGDYFTSPLLPRPRLFSLNNSEMVKFVTLTFCSIHQQFTGDVRVEFGSPQWPQSPDIGQPSDGGISNFRISGEAIIKINCHSFRTSGDIDIEKQNKLKKMTSCRKIVMSLPFFQLTANLEQSGSRIHDA